MRVNIERMAPRMRCAALPQVGTDRFEGCTKKDEARIQPNRRESCLSCALKVQSLNPNSKKLSGEMNAGVWVEITPRREQGVKSTL